MELKIQENDRVRLRNDKKSKDYFNAAGEVHKLIIRKDSQSILTECIKELKLNMSEVALIRELTKRRLQEILLGRQVNGDNFSRR